MSGSSARSERRYEYAPTGITARGSGRPNSSDDASLLAGWHRDVRGRLRQHQLRATHPPPDPDRVGSADRVRAPRALVHDEGSPRLAARRQHRLLERARPIPCDGEDPHLAAAEGLRARVERRAPEGTPEGREKHRTVGTHPRWRWHDPPDHA